MVEKSLEVLFMALPVSTTDGKKMQIKVFWQPTLWQISGPQQDIGET